MTHISVSYFLSFASAYSLGATSSLRDLISSFFLKERYIFNARVFVIEKITVNYSCTIAAPASKIAV